MSLCCQDYQATLSLKEEEIKTLHALVADLERHNEILRLERNHAREQYEHSIKILMSVHSLLYPPPIKLDDGRTMMFRPKDTDPHEVLQALSDRIRAIPDAINEAMKP